VADVGAATGTARSPSRSFAYPLILALSALDAAGYSVIAGAADHRERIWRSSRTPTWLDLMCTHAVALLPQLLPD
jgi:hypothetical protein